MSEIWPYNRSPTDPSEELLLGVFNMHRAWHSQNTGFLLGLPGDQWLCTYSSPTTRDAPFEGPVSGLQDGETWCAYSTPGTPSGTGVL